MAIDQYNRKGGSATRTTARETNPEEAAVLGRAITAVGETVFNIGSNVAKKERSRKEQALLDKRRKLLAMGKEQGRLDKMARDSRYEVTSKALETEILSKKNDALIEQNADPETILEKIIEPELDKYEASLPDNPEIRARWEIDKGRIINGWQFDRAEMKRDENVALIGQDAQSLLYNDQEEAANQKFDSLVGIVGQAAVSKMRSKAYSGKARTEMRQMALAYSEDPSLHSEYLESLQNIEKTIGENDNILPADKYSLIQESIAKQRNLKTAAARTTASTVYKITSDTDNGDLDSDRLDLYRAQIGDKAFEAVLQASKLQMLESAETDEDAMYAWSVIQSAVSGDAIEWNKSVPFTRGWEAWDASRDNNGKIPWSKAIELIKDNAGNYGAIGVAVLNLQMAETIDSASSLSAYDGWWKDVVVDDVDMDTSDFVKTMAYYLNQKDSGYASYIKEKTKSFNEWKADQGDQTYDEWKVSAFKKNAKQLMGGFTTRQDGQIQTVTTKEEYDALPSGAEFIEDGKRYRKP